MDAERKSFLACSALAYNQNWNICRGNLRRNAFERLHSRAHARYEIPVLQNGNMSESCVCHGAPLPTRSPPVPKPGRIDSCSIERIAMPLPAGERLPIACKAICILYL